VGKSSLLLRYVDHVFIEDFSKNPLGVDSRTKSLYINGNNIELQIWDTGGQERFRSITSSFYRGTKGIIVTYDVCDMKGFSNISRWCKEIDLFEEHVQKILVGTKCDCPSERKISIKDGEDLGAKLELPFIETSSKTNTNIDEAFNLLVNEIVKQKEM